MQDEPSGLIMGLEVPFEKVLSYGQGNCDATERGWE